MNWWAWGLAFMALNILKSSYMLIQCWRDGDEQSWSFLVWFVVFICSAAVAFDALGVS